MISVCIGNLTPSYSFGELLSLSQSIISKLEDITEPIKEVNTRSSNTYGLNTLEYTKYEQTKTNPNLNSQTNNIMVSIFKLNNNDNERGDIIQKNDEDNEKIKRGERKKSTIAEFHQIKIPVIKILI